MLLLGGQTPEKESETILRKIAKVFAQEDEIKEASLKPEIETNQYGGLQSRLDGDFTQLSPQFLLALAKLVKQGWG